MSGSPQPAESTGSLGPSSPRSVPGQDNDKLQIRVVPYSPPRISSEASSRVSSRPVSYNIGEPLPQSPSDHSDGPDGSSTPRGRDNQGLPNQHGVSDFDSPVLSSPTEFEAGDSSSRASSLRSMSPRPKRAISINSDKTFSLVPHSESSLSSRVGSFGSPQFSTATPSGSWGRVSSSVFLLEDRSTTSLNHPQPARRFSSPSSSASPPVGLGCSPVPPGAAWGQRVHSGVRKVETSPVAKGKQPAYLSSSADESLPPLPENINSATKSFITPELSSQASFRTFRSNSTLSDRTNYKIYGESSPVTPAGRRQALPDSDASLSASPEESNYQVLGESSPANPNYEILGKSSPPTQAANDESRPPTGDSDANYIVYQHSSASCSSLASTKGHLGPQFSRESLVVAPLRPGKQRSFHRSRVSKSRSRESFRPGSLTSLSTTMTQEATRALFMSSSSQNPDAAADWQESGGSPGPEKQTIPPAMNPHSHRWSRPLSTVLSESEGGSEPPSRALSQFSIPDRRGSGFQSLDSRNFLSMSPSPTGLGEQQAVSSQGNSSPERPATTLGRSLGGREISSTPRQIRDYDEDGDGLADLEELHHRSSWSRLPKSGSSSSLDRAVRSSGSTRSLNPFTLPAWARLYYGSGEQRFIIAQASTDSMRSLYNGSMYNDPPYNELLSHPPPRAQPSRTPSIENMASTIRNPRRRPRDMLPTSDVEMAQGPQHPLASHPPAVPSSVHSASGIRGAAYRLKKKTSSVWSPHLGRDRRSGYGIWDPPSAVWSTQGGFHWRTHPQLVLFVIGFLIPFGKFRIQMDDPM